MTVDDILNCVNAIHIVSVEKWVKLKCLKPPYRQILYLKKPISTQPPTPRTKRKQKENLCICKSMHNDITKTTKK